MMESYRIRTDLALETTERFSEEKVEVRGVEIEEDYNREKDIKTTVVKIRTGLRQLRSHKTSYKIAGSRLNSGFFSVKSCQIL